MKIRFVKMQEDKPIKLGKKDSDCVPSIGHKLVWADDAYYVVEDVEWDFFIDPPECVVIICKID